MAMKYHPNKVKDLVDEYQKAAQEAYDQLRKVREME